jgi:ParB/RepB/Spo0J family partition protein
MQLETTKNKIRLSQINWQDKKFCTSYFVDLTELKKSISAVGILNLPIVQSISENEFRIVSGWRRLKVLLELEQEFCEVYITDEDKPDLELFELILHENLSIREFNLMEKAFIIKNLADEFELSDNEIIDKYLPLLKLGNNPKWLDWAQKLVDFPSQVQQAFARELLSFDLIDFLNKMKSQDQEQFVTLVNILHLGKNRQKELATLLADLSRLKNLSFYDLLNEEDVVKIVEHKKLTHSQKTAKLFEWLKTQRFPAYSKVEKKFVELIRSLKIPNNLQIKHSPYFESDWFSLQFSFRNLDDFCKVVEVQNQISNAEQIGKLFHITDRNQELV